MTKELQEQLFDIWVEGYSVTGNSCTAWHLGSAKGVTFRNACVNYHKRNPDKFYNEDSNSIWGCKLFDNQSDARKSFG
jgi:hypothetical protein